MASDVALVVARPRRAVLLMAVGSLATALVPVTAMLILVATSLQSWVPAAAAEVVAILLCVLLGWRQLSLVTRVTGAALEGNGFATPMVRVPLARIAEVHLVDTWVGQSGETVTQLLVLDGGGRRLFRMRGNYWSAGALDRIAAALPVGAIRSAEPMTMSRFFEAFPTSEYWFENKPWVRVAGAAVGVVAAAAIALWVMTVVGGQTS